MSYNPTVIGLSQTIQTLTEVVRSMANQKPIDSTERTTLSDFAARLDSLGDLETVTVDDIISVTIGMPEYVLTLVSTIALLHRQLELTAAVNTRLDVIHGDLDTIEAILNPGGAVGVDLDTIITRLDNISAREDMIIQQLDAYIDSNPIDLANSGAARSIISLTKGGLVDSGFMGPVPSNGKLHVNVSGEVSSVGLSATETVSIFVEFIDGATTVHTTTLAYFRVPTTADAASERVRTFEGDIFLTEAQWAAISNNSRLNIGVNSPALNGAMNWAGHANVRWQVLSQFNLPAG